MNDETKDSTLESLGMRALVAIRDYAIQREKEAEGKAITMHGESAIRYRAQQEMAREFVAYAKSAIAIIEAAVAVPPEDPKAAVDSLVDPSVIPAGWKLVANRASAAQGDRCLNSFGLWAEWDPWFDDNPEVRDARLWIRREEKGA